MLCTELDQVDAHLQLFPILLNIDSQQASGCMPGRTLSSEASKAKQDKSG